MVVVAASHNWVRRVRHFVRPPSVERCEFCAAVIPSRHQHLVETAARRIRCACRLCATAMTARGNGDFRLVPQRSDVLNNFQLSDAEWDALQIPIGMAFVFQSTPEGRPVALYPGPAGATESLLTLDGWAQLVGRNPVLASLRPDVEALLVNRTNGQREYFRVPIDRCYALVGIIRRNWRGFAGGKEAWDAINQFFAELRGGRAGLSHG